MIEKTNDREDLMKVFLQHKVQMLQEEKTKQHKSLISVENIKTSHKEDRLTINETQNEEVLNNSPERRAPSQQGTSNDAVNSKTDKSNDLFGKSIKTGFSRGVTKLKTITEKDEIKVNSSPKKPGNSRRRDQGDNIAETRKLTFVERNINEGLNNLPSKSINTKKILLESDDEDNINEMKEIEPLMILAHQNVKPTKYIFNTKYIGEKISESDKRFLSPRLPNLFKDLSKKESDINEENFVEDHNHIKDRKSTQKNYIEDHDGQINYSVIHKHLNEHTQRLSTKDHRSQKKRINIIDETKD